MVFLSFMVVLKGLERSGRLLGTMSSWWRPTNLPWCRAMINKNNKLTNISNTSGQGEDRQRRQDDVPAARTPSRCRHPLIHRIRCQLPSLLRCRPVSRCSRQRDHWSRSWSRCRSRCSDWRLKRRCVRREHGDKRKREGWFWEK